MGRLTTAAMLAAFFAIVLGLASCGGASTITPQQTVPTNEIPWPPNEDNLRMASSDVITLSGRDDYSAKSDGAYTIPFPVALQLGKDGKFNWATYSLGGFSDNLDFGSLTLNYEYRPNGPDDGTELWLGFANYELGHWELLDLTGEAGDTYFHDVSDDTAYLSPIGAVHFAIVFFTPLADGLDNGYTNILSLEVTRDGDTSLAPPTGLVAVESLDEISLTWLEVPTADGYHIYRDIDKAFPSPVKLTDGLPVTGLAYADDTVDRGVMYYYKASSTKLAIESPLSDFVDIFSPEYTKAAPTNPHGYSLGPDSYVVQWDWDGSFPNHFLIYYSEEPDFGDLDSLTAIQVSGIKTDYELDLSGIAGDTIYWRICAFQDPKRGFMTDDVMGVTITVWTWESPEVLGSGSAPISLVKAGGDYSAAYINGTNVDFSRRTGGTWATETAMSADTFGNYVAMSYSGSEYVIGTQDNAAHDLHMAVGTPGSWSESKVHGDDGEGIPHPSSGNTIVVASSATEHVAIHSLPAGETNDGAVILHTKPVGSGSWSAGTDLWDASAISDELSLAELDGNFHLLYLDTDGGEVFKSDKDGGWSPYFILDAADAGIGAFTSLTRFSGEWWTPAHNSSPGERQIHFLNGGESGTWNKTLHQDTGHTGEFASMAALDTKLFCVYFRRDADQWEFALYDGVNWVTNWLIIPGSEFSRAVAGGLGDVPFVLFDDLNEFPTQIKAVAGTPPT